MTCPYEQKRNAMHDRDLAAHGETLMAAEDCCSCTACGYWVVDGAPCFWTPGVEGVRCLVCRNHVHKRREP